MAAYVRKKKVGRYEYYQLVESRRVEGKPRQKVLIHLGHHHTVEEALRAWPQEIKRLRRAASKDRKIVVKYGEEAKYSPHARDTLKRADSADQKADDLETNLKKLRELRQSGVA